MHVVRGSDVVRKSVGAYGEGRVLRWWCGRSVRVTSPFLFRMLSKDVVQRTYDLIHALNVSNASVGLSIEEQQALHNLAHTHTHHHTMPVLVLA